MYIYICNQNGDLFWNVLDYLDDLDGSIRGERIEKNWCKSHWSSKALRKLMAMSKTANGNATSEGYLDGIL